MVDYASDSKVLTSVSPVNRLQCLHSAFTSNFDFQAQ